MKNNFPGTSDAKIKKGVFFGPQIRELIKVKFTLEQVTKAQRGSRGIDLLLL